MTISRRMFTAAGLGLAAAPAVAAFGTPQAQAAPKLSLYLRQPLGPGDGWASVNGVTGGAAAASVTTVTTWAQLKAAVAGDAPKIVVVSGTMNANTNASGHTMTAEDYAAGTGYSLAAYLAAYDPAVWGWTRKPSGAQETARLAAAARQKAQVVANIGSNTTLIGLQGSEVLGAALQVNKATNVIVRGMTLTNTYDCFPAWDPTDGATGNWNSEYDNLTVTESTDVWIDHNDLSDGDALDSQQPLYFGRPYQIHDGLLDIVRGSDLVTVSWNRIHDHDKVSLIGNSDSRTTDRGKLRVTLHHNEWRATGQRCPRVRFGQVDAYNNLYVADAQTYGYTWGIGIESQLVAEHNSVWLPAEIDPATVITVFKGTRMTERNNLLNGAPYDFLGAYNATHDPDLLPDAGWVPTRRSVFHDAGDLKGVVPAHAGPRGLGRGF